MDNFDKEFNKQFKSISRWAKALLTVQIILIVLIFGACGWLLFKILQHLGWI